MHVRSLSSLNVSDFACYYTTDSSNSMQCAVTQVYATTYTSFLAITRITPATLTAKSFVLIRGTWMFPILWATVPLFRAINAIECTITQLYATTYLLDICICSRWQTPCNVLCVDTGNLNTLQVINKTVIFNRTLIYATLRRSPHNHHSLTQCIL